MKLLLFAIFLVFLSVSGVGETIVTDAMRESAEEKTSKFKLPDRYSLIGLSLYSEDTDAMVGSGIGLRLRGFGLQFNNRFGLEGFLDFAPKLDTSSIEDVSDIDLSGKDVELKTKRSSYASLVGTLTHPMNERWSLIGKVGYCRYSSKFHVFFKDDLLFPRRLVKDSGSDAVVSFGMLRSLRNSKDEKPGEFRKRAIEFSLTKMFGDAGPMSINVRLRGI